MKSAVCTLFEGSYHLGVAALVNSLVRNGFLGEFYAGYRGELPRWAEDSKSKPLLGFEHVRMMPVVEGVSIHFIKLHTEYHFTNYKPDFMLELLEGAARQAEAIFYIDPDIVLNAPWHNFETWLTAGVALCEDVNSPVSENHPKRVGWRKHFGQNGINLNFREPQYVNGGFIALKRQDIQFLKVWKELQEIMAPVIGGLNRSSLKGQPLDENATGVFAPFGKTDQDALNATIEASELPAAIAGKEAMGFIAGRAILPHALGQPKPWENQPIRRAFHGHSPRMVDKLYWEFVDEPITVFTNSKIRRMKRLTRLAAFIGRFYARN